MPEQTTSAIDSIPVAEKKESFVYSSSNGEIQIEFADGVRRIPQHIVHASGGIDALAEMAPQLKALTYCDFIGGMEEEISRQSLNSYQKHFIGRHFGGNF